MTLNFNTTNLTYFLPPEDDDARVADALDDLRDGKRRRERLDRSIEAVPGAAVRVREPDLAQVRQRRDDARQELALRERARKISWNARTNAHALRALAFARAIAGLFLSDIFTFL